MALGGEQYAHTLIPDPVDFAPQPQQVASFFDRLVTLSAIPLQAELAVLKRSGEFRSGSDPLTGKTISVPVSARIPMKTIAEIPQTLEGLEHYDVRVSGGGPPALPPFQLWQLALRGSTDGDRAQAETKKVVAFDTEMSYAFNVACCLRAELVSTSYWEDEGSSRKPPLFGEPCRLKERTGFFPKPSDGTLITVPNAGCARFWIEFEFGKWIFPKVENTFDVLDPRIVNCAEQTFGTKFVQGCHWN